MERKLSLPGRPSVKVIVEQLGPLYQPATRAAFVEARLGSWAGNSDASDHVSIRFTLGARGEEIEILVGRKARGWWDFPLATSVILTELNRQQGQSWRLNFPLHVTVEKSRQRIQVDGREIDFEVVICGRSAVALADLDGRELRVKCSASRLARLNLLPLALPELRSIVRKDGRSATLARRAV